MYVFFTGGPKGPVKRHGLMPRLTHGRTYEGSPSPRAFCPIGGLRELQQTARGHPPTWKRQTAVCPTLADFLNAWLAKKLWTRSIKITPGLEEHAEVSVVSSLAVQCTKSAIHALETPMHHEALKPQTDSLY